MITKFDYKIPCVYKNIDNNGIYSVDKNYKFFTVKKDNKYNIINNEKKLVSDVWYDWINNECINGFIKVKDGRLSNLIDVNGKLISNDWFDYISDVVGNIVTVQKYNKYNLINTDGKLVSNIWFDCIISRYCNGCVINVKLNNNTYTLRKQNGKYNLKCVEDNL